MRKARLLTATAMALILTALPALTLADTSISTETTTALRTSVAGNVTIASGGSIKLTTGPAITVDSNNNVILTGNINMAESADNSVGILIDGGRTADLTVNGNITVTDNFTPTDTGNTAGSTADGILEPPYATGTGRYGIRSIGTTPFVGDVVVGSTSTITVQGNQSYGIRFENRIDGDFKFDGKIAIDGEGNTAISLENGASGLVYLSGSATAWGKDSKVVNLSGEFATVIIDGSYSSTGYSTTSSNITPDQISKLLPSNKLQSGPTIDINGNVSNGILIGVIPTDTDAGGAKNDEDGDGLLDATQQTADIINYGQAAALRIASTTADLTIGGLTYGAGNVSPPAVNYGLLVRGKVSGLGYLPGFDATGIQLAGLGNDVTIANGVGIYGQVTATASNGDATGLAVMSGTITPRIDVAGSLRGIIATDDGSSARAIVISAGANLPALYVNQGGSILASATGSTGKAVAIMDESGLLTSIVNRSAIGAEILATDDNKDGVADAVLNRPIAIDVRANATGVTVSQIDPAPTDSAADLAIPAPSISGDILFGSGNDVLSVQGGRVTGNVDFGAGANTFTLDGGAIYGGRVTGSGTVALNITKGDMLLVSGTSINATTLAVGAESSLSLIMNVDAPSTAAINASGTATFANGAEINLLLNGILLAPERFTVLTAGSIDLGTITTASLEGKTPWLYAVELNKNTANTQLYADFRLKNQTELSMSNNEYGALMPILTVVEQDVGASSAMLGRTERAAFHNVYNQYLPDHSGENLLTLSRGSQALNRTLSDMTVIPTNSGGQYWLQEQGFGAERDYGDVNGFEASGFVFAGGRETALNSQNMAGVYLSFTSSSPFDSFAVAQEQMVNSDLTIGGYWRYRNENVRMWAHGGLGYVSFDTTRQLITSSVTHISHAKWNGTSVTAGAGAAYETKLGGFILGPKVMVGYYGLKEDSYEETGGGDYFDLQIAERNSHLLSGTALVNFTYDRWFIKPEAWVGWKQNLSGEMDPTVANFRGDPTFSLDGGDLAGGGPIAGFRVRADNEWSYFAIEAEYEDLEAYKAYSISLKTRFQF